MARSTPKPTKDQLDRINAVLSGEDKKYREFESKVKSGKNFGNEEVKRAIAAGYSMQDVNDYLKFSGTTPTGDFAVGGYEKQTAVGGSGDGAGSYTKDVPFYRYVGPSVPAPAPPKAPDPSPEPPKPSAPTSAPVVAPGNPELAIPKGSSPEMSPGQNIRLVGETLGIKPKDSSARKAKLINKGTGRLTIPRSSGFQPLNFG